MRTRGVAGVALALLTSVATPSWADSPPVNLQIEHCDTLDEEEVARIFAAELGATLSVGHLPETTEVLVECERGRALLKVRDPVTRKGLSRAVALQKDAPETHARLVAIAATELVLASWVEIEFNPEPRVPPAGSKPPAAVSEAVRRTVTVHQAGPSGQRGLRRRRDEPPPNEVRFLVLASSRVFFQSRGAALFGGGLRAAAELSDAVSWWVDYVGESGHATLYTYYDQVTQEAIDYSYNVWLASAGAGVMFFRRWGRATLRLGGGLRLGGTGGSPDQVDYFNKVRQPKEMTNGQLAMLGWPLAIGSVSFKLDEALVVEISAESSYLWGAPQSPALSGIWCAGQVGLGVSL